MSKKLISLEEHEKRRSEIHKLLSGGIPNGIACPQCGNEMEDSNPGVMLPCNPPRFQIKCPKCGHCTNRS